MRGLERRIDEEVGQGPVEPVSPRITFGLGPAACGLFPLGLARQAECLPGYRRKPCAIRRGVVITDEGYGVAGTLAGRVTLIPDVGSARLAERALALEAAGLYDERQFVDCGRSVTRVLDESGVLRVSDWVDTQQKIVHVNPVDGPLVFFGVLRAHEELTGRDQRKFWREVARHEGRQEDSASGFSTTLAA